MTIVFSGPDGVATYRATALKHGLRLYAKTKMKPNRAWTPTAMLREAGKITGKTYKRGDYEKAASDLGAWLANFGTVLSEGQYRAIVCDGWPKAYPEGRPHYE